MQNIVIIGNGISGITAAREIRKRSEVKIQIISSESEHFFSRTALMYIYMGHMTYEHTKPYEDAFWQKNNLELLFDHVQEVKFEQNKVVLSSGTFVDYDQLILAVGSIPNRFGWEGENLIGVQGLYSKQDLELLEARSKNIEHAVVVGGGLIGIELAEMLASRKKQVSLLVRENSFWNHVLPPEESSMINKHIEHHGINLLLNTELDKILGENEVEAIITKDGNKINCEFVGLTVGVRPNIDFLRNTTLAINRGIVVNEFLQTNLPNVYAIGDCAEQSSPQEGRRSLEQIWYTGRLMGECLAKNICGEKTPYRPGVFFNSAKFLDIEYQTYGNVPAKTPENEESYVWVHPTENKLFRINWDKNNLAVTGTNVFGIRMRHLVWENWIQNKSTVYAVMDSLEKAHFDPEFFKRYEKEIRKDFNAQYTNK